MNDRLWGGRFGSGPDDAMHDLTRSIDVDIVLLPYDVAATKAHVRALVKAGLLDAPDASAIEDACDGILAEVLSGSAGPADQDEDVHGFLERLLIERLGDVGRRVHAGRSRNDLVVTDLRLWCRAAAEELVVLVDRTITRLVEVAEREIDTVMPGYTHLQRALPVTVGFHLAAHGFALARDRTRFTVARASSDVSPLGAGALATSTLGIDPTVAAAELGFGEVFANAMDVVADRDFVVDLTYACALCCVHLSRLAEEIVLWTSAEFGFATLDEAWATGSSMMPHKRNPDMAELVRGRAAATSADLQGLLGTLKGLPLAYNRDLQEDKEIVFRAVDRTMGSLRAIAGLVGALAFNAAALRAAASGPIAWATDAAEALVARGVPFRTAHHAIGRLVAHVEATGAPLLEVDAATLASFHPDLTRADLAIGDDAVSRRGPGGPAPDRVREQLAQLTAIISS